MTPDHVSMCDNLARRPSAPRPNSTMRRPSAIYLLPTMCRPSADPSPHTPLRVRARGLEAPRLRALKALPRKDHTFVEGVLAAAGLPCSFLTPEAWKRTVGLTLASKDASRAEAIWHWPGNASLFARVKDDVLAEAALIATAGLLRKGANP